MVREIKFDELNELLKLYLYLHEKNIPEENDHLKNTWDTIMNDKYHHIIVNVIDDKIVSSCVLVIIPNLTRNVRPYAIIENVVTNEDYRNKGYATECLNYASNIAEKENCYKIMISTSSKEKSTLDFYEKAGYNGTEKTCFIKRFNK